MMKDWMNRHSDMLVKVMIGFLVSCEIAILVTLILYVGFSIKGDGQYHIKTIVTEDSHRVPCLMSWDSNIVSCDWLNADGTDKVE